MKKIIITLLFCFLPFSAISKNKDSLEEFWSVSFNYDLYKESKNGQHLVMQLISGILRGAGHTAMTVFKDEAAMMDFNACLMIAPPELLADAVFKDYRDGKISADDLFHAKILDQAAIYCQNKLQNLSGKYKQSE